MNKILLAANQFRPSNLMKRMRSHLSVSEGSKAKIMAVRNILGRQVTFYENGLRVIEDQDDVTEEEQFNSQVLRLAHASLLIGEPVGDKRMCYVDATKYIVEVWIWGVEARVFVKRALDAMKNGADRSFFLDNSLQEIKNERNVELFGRSASSTHLPNQ